MGFARFVGKMNILSLNNLERITRFRCSVFPAFWKGIPKYNFDELKILEIKQGQKDRVHTLRTWMGRINDFKVLSGIFERRSRYQHLD